MAYMSQEKKAKIAPKIKAILAKYKVKGSLSVRNHSTLCLTLKSGAIDFIANSNNVCGNDFYQVARGFRPNTGGYDQVNPYHFQNHYDGVALEFMREVFTAMIRLCALGNSATAAATKANLSAPIVSGLPTGVVKFNCVWGPSR